jgi:hypothetical protein
MITKFGKRFLANFISGNSKFSSKEMALGISTGIEYPLSDTNSRLGFEFYRVPIRIGGVDIDNSVTGLGLGYKNSLAIIGTTDPGESTAASLTRAYSNNSLSDWYLPSAAELNELYKWANGNVTQPALGTPAIDGDLNSLVNGFTSNFDFVNHYYWSSSETNAKNAWSQPLDYAFFLNYLKSNNFYVRPTRAF